MGREIRKVPQNWEHPKREHCSHWPKCNPICFQPKYNREFKKSADEWIEGLNNWDYKRYNGENTDNEYWEYEGSPPDREYHLDYDPDKLGDDSWFQLYETVSEGTPVSPAFASKEELADYLAENGDYWDQRRRRDYPDEAKQGRHGPWGTDQAYKFVMGNGSAPSMVLSNKGLQSGVEFVTSED